MRGPLALLVALALVCVPARAGLDVAPGPPTAQQITSALGYAPMPPVFGQIGPGATWTGAAAGGVEKSLLGSGSGTASITCPYPGATWRISGGGVFSTAAIPGNITPKIVFGAGSVSRTIANVIANGNNSRWWGLVMLTCVTVGTSGTMRATGVVNYATSDTAEGTAGMNNDGAVITLDNTGAMPVDIRVLMASTSASNVFRLDVLAIERVY